MLSICMDASQVVLNSVDCTGVRNACEDLTASEYDASSMVPRWTALPRLLEPPDASFWSISYGKENRFSLNLMSLRFSDGLAEVYLWCVLNRTMVNGLQVTASERSGFPFMEAKARSKNEF